MIRRHSVAAGRALEASNAADYCLIVVDTTSFSQRHSASVVHELRQRFLGDTLLVLESDGDGASLLRGSRSFRASRSTRPHRFNVLVERIHHMLCARGVPRRHVPHIPACVINAIQFMVTHYRERLLVVDIAGAVDVHPDRLTRLFHEALGIPVKDYILRLRVLIASRLLSETGHTLESVAERCGFADASYFSRVFLEHTGERPGQFRREHARHGDV